MMLNRQGVVPDPVKIQVCLSYQNQRPEALLQSFLGMINYLSRLDPKVADLTHKPRSLLKKSNEFIWIDVHLEDFKKIIETMCKNPKLLRYYKPELDLYLETDAHGMAMGMASFKVNKMIEALYTQ